MRIPLKDITEDATDLVYAEAVTELNGMLREGHAHDYEFPGALDVHVSYYRAERDLLFDGEFSGRATATCARCLETFPLDVGSEFSVVLSPQSALAGDEELSEAEMVRSFYQGSDVDLTRLIYEQVILTLPTRPLCGEQCQGLCPRCGTNRNNGSCTCQVEAGDPRLAILRTLKIDRGV